jgi:lysophospholipase L1-like esterase
MNSKKEDSTVEKKEQKSFKYIPVGDSYTIGNGVAKEERWPNLLVRHLNESGVNTELLKNPAVSGFTVEDAINYEVPELDGLHPDLVTILIGANDSFQGVAEEVFAKDYSRLLDGVEKTIPPEGKIFLISIPDYSSSPAAKDYPETETERVLELIKKYNIIIKNEAAQRKLEFIDIFPVSQTMKTDEYYIEDGLHPSKKGYELWEEGIFRSVLKALTK